MKKRSLSLVLALVLILGAFPAAVAGWAGDRWADDIVRVEPVGGTVTRAEIEAAIIKKILSEPVVIEDEYPTQIGPLNFYDDYDDYYGYDFDGDLDLHFSDESDTASLTFPAEMARFAFRAGRQSGSTVDCDGELTQSVPVKAIEGAEQPVVLFADGVPAIVLGGTGETATVSYGTGYLTPRNLNMRVCVGNQQMKMIYGQYVMGEILRRSGTEMVTATLTRRTATAEEQGAFQKACAVDVRVTDTKGRDLSEALIGEYQDDMLSVKLPFRSNLTRCLGKIQETEQGEMGEMDVWLAGCGTYVFGRWDSPFEDVYEDAWFFPAVFDAVDRGRMTGTSATQFSIWYGVTREMLVTTLWRMAGKPGSNTNILSYVDASSVSEYAIGAFQWALEKKMINPAGDRLNPKEMVTREMFAVIFTNYATAQGKGPTEKQTVPSYYDDQDQISKWAIDSVAFMMNQGWMTAVEEEWFFPKYNCSRVVVAQVLMMFEQ